MNNEPFIYVIENEILPKALMMGVAHDLFWKLNPKSLSPFIKAFELKRKYDDEMSWMQGLYIQMAVGGIISKKSKYPENPLLSGKHGQLSEEEVIKNKVINQMEIINSRFNEVV